MTNEEIAMRIQNGERDMILDLWEGVRPYARRQAARWARSGYGGVEIDDLQQTAFLVLLDALEAYQPENGKFITWFALRLKGGFTEATGQRTRRERADPLQSAVSLDVPLSDDESGELNLVDTIADPGAAEQIEAVAEQDFILHRHRAVMAALDELPGELKDVVIRKFWNNEAVDTKLLRLATRKLRHPDISRELKIYQ